MSPGSAMKDGICDGRPKKEISLHVAEGILNICYAPADYPFFSSCQNVISVDRTTRRDAGFCRFKIRERRGLFLLLPYFLFRSKGESLTKQYGSLSLYATKSPCR
jgi:hypothetical protein